MTTGFGPRFCHPEPGPEPASGSNNVGIQVLGLEKLGFKAPPLGGVLYSMEAASKIPLKGTLRGGKGLINEWTANPFGPILSMEARAQSIPLQELRLSGISKTKRYLRSALC